MLPGRALPGKILEKYVLREVALPTILTVLVFTGILFLARVLKLIELVIGKDVAISQMLWLFSCIIPRFLEIALPMSLLLGVIVGIGRLSADSEIVVMRGCGIGINHLVKPVLTFAAIVSLVGIFVSVWLRPYANYELGLGLYKIAKAKAQQSLAPGVFNDFGPLTVYAEKISDSGSKLESVLLADFSEISSPKIFIAKHGQLIADGSQRNLTLRLYDGTIFQGSGTEQNVTRFNINNISFSPEALSAGESSFRGKKTSEMFIPEILTAVEKIEEETGGDPSKLDKKGRKRYFRFLVELQKKFSLPTSCLFAALLALSLGIQPSRGGMNWGSSLSVLVGVFVLITYYLLFALAKALGEQGALPIWFIMWLPNVLLGALGIYLFRQVGSERWLAVSEALGEFFINMSRKFSRIFNSSKGQ